MLVITALFLSFFFFPSVTLARSLQLKKKYFFKEPAFLHCFSIFKSMTYAPLLFPVPFVLGEVGVYIVFLSLFS